MGACDFQTTAAGKDMVDAFSNAVNDALYESGHDSYNGTISTTSIPDRPDDIRFKKWSTLNKYIEKELNSDRCPKWECRCVELKGKMLREYKAKHGLKRTRKKVYVFFGWASC